MKTSLACLTSELEFFLTYIILLIITVACLYNIAQETEVEYSKLLLSTSVGVCIPSPRLKYVKSGDRTQQ